MATTNKIAIDLIWGLFSFCSCHLVKLTSIHLRWPFFFCFFFFFEMTFLKLTPGKDILQFFVILYPRRRICKTYQRESSDTDD